MSAPSASPAAWIPRFWGSSPLFEAVAGQAAALGDLDDFPGVDTLTARLLQGDTGPGAPLSFELQTSKRSRRGPISLDALYDGRIHRLGRIPTRARSWHDLMNALAWATFPRTKRSIHARQHDELARILAEAPARLPNARTRIQDALAMLDEGGVVVAALPDREASLRAAVAEGDGDAIAERVRSGQARVLVLGHAILEHAVLGAGPVRASPVVMGVRALEPLSSLVAEVDVELAIHVAEHLTAPGRAPALLVTDSLFPELCSGARQGVEAP